LNRQTFMKGTSTLLNLLIYFIGRQVLRGKCLKFLMIQYCPPGDHTHFRLFLLRDDIILDRANNSKLFSIIFIRVMAKGALTDYFFFYIILIVYIQCVCVIF